MKNIKTFTVNVEQVAAALNCSPATARRRFRACEIDPNKPLTLKDVIRAWAGDLREEKIRETRARADLLEIERRQLEKDLVTSEQVQDTIRSALGPVRQRFLSLPVEMAARCNPSDPVLAKTALEQWRDESMRLVMESLKE
jgi:hypothetical protein